MDNNLLENKTEDQKLLSGMENDEARNFQEAAIEPRKNLKKINFEMILLLLLGFLIGVVVKTEASRRFTIGYEDYRLVGLKQGYDIEQLEKNLVEKMNEDKNEEGKIE